jgi:Ca2+/H+ antiporter
VSTLALFLPVHIASYNLASNVHVLIMSRGAAIFMLLMYVQLMVFQLKTHAHIYVEADEPPAVAAAAAKQVSFCSSLQQQHAALIILVT